MYSFVIYMNIVREGVSISSFVIYLNIGREGVISK